MWILIIIGICFVCYFFSKVEENNIEVQENKSPKKNKLTITKEVFGDISTGINDLSKKIKIKKIVNEANSEIWVGSKVQIESLNISLSQAKRDQKLAEYLKDEQRRKAYEEGQEQLKEIIKRVSPDKSDDENDIIYKIDKQVKCADFVIPIKTQYPEFFDAIEADFKNILAHHNEQIRNIIKELDSNPNLKLHFNKIVTNHERALRIESPYANQRLSHFKLALKYKEAT